LNSQQRAFLEHIGMLIPKLFEAIRLGNVKSECVLGDRIIGNRQVRLKLVAEVVDPGSNPLATHSQRSSFQPVRAVSKEVTTEDSTGADNQDQKDEPSKTNDETSATANKAANKTVNKPSSKKTKRAPRRKHPMSR
jgi:hypothetical protein